MRRAAVVAWLAVLLHAAPARAETDPNECIEASETGQRARNASDLLTARSLFEKCAQRECPHVVREDCVRWIDDVAAQTPSIVVAAVDEAGRDVFDASVVLDGREIAPALDGKELSLNPGTHAVEVVLADGTRLSDKILVRAGEKRRIVTLRRAPLPVIAPVRAEPPPSRPFPVVPVALGSAGVVAGGIALALALSANAQVFDLRERCGQPSTCTQSDVDPVDDKRLAAVIVGTVGGAAIVAAIVLYVVRPSEPRTRAMVDAASMRVRF
jgi:hypothetical protein